MSETKTISVTRLVRRMRNLLEIELGELWVEGEVSNLRKQASGHIYFTLKDEGAQMSCVLFKGNARYAKVEPENGMQVKLFSEVSVYEARGSVQLIVKKAEPAGEGELQAKFERLKNKLRGEGLFDETHKQPIPAFPKNVGLITSGTGAALQDMLNVISRRAPWVQPILYPVQVQGKGAEQGIARAIQRWSTWEENGLPEVDVIIVGRGGGSLEDLWNFNEEVVVRAIHECRIPIVSAVGHEIDFTIVDFVADMRAPTPSAAAEMVTPDGEALSNRLERLGVAITRTVVNKVEKYDAILQSMRRSISRSPERLLRDSLQRLILARRDLDDSVMSKMSMKANDLQELHYRISAQKPLSVIERRLDKVTHLTEKLETLVADKLMQKENHVSEMNALLKALGPESVFTRGFSVTCDAEGNILKSSDQLKAGDIIKTKFHKGEATSEIKEASSSSSM